MSDDIHVLLIMTTSVTGHKSVNGTRKNMTAIVLKIK